MGIGPDFHPKMLGDDFLDALDNNSASHITLLIERKEIFTDYTSYYNALLDTLEAKKYEITEFMLKLWRVYANHSFETDYIDAWAHFRNALKAYPEFLPILLNNNDVIFSVDMVRYITRSDDFSMPDKIRSCCKMNLVLRKDVFQRNQKILEHMCMDNIRNGHMELATAIFTTFSNELDAWYMYNYTVRHDSTKDELSILMFLASHDRLDDPDQSVLIYLTDYRQYISGKRNAETEAALQFIFQLERMTGTNYDKYFTFFMDAIEHARNRRVENMVKLGFSLKRNDINKALQRAYVLREGSYDDSDTTGRSRRLSLITEHIIRRYGIETRRPYCPLSPMIFPRFVYPRPDIPEVYSAAIALALRNKDMEKADSIIKTIPYGLCYRDDVIFPILEILIYNAIRLVSLKLLDYVEKFAPSPGYRGFKEWRTYGFKRVLDDAGIVKTIREEYEKKLLLHERLHNR